MPRWLDKMVESGDEAMLGQFKDAFGGEVPDLDRLADILETAPEEKVQDATRHALSQLSANERADIGGLLDGYLINSGTALAVPADAMAKVARGDNAAIGDLLGSLLKGQGLGALNDLFADAPDSDPTGIFGFITGLMGGDDSDFGVDDMAAILKNPLALALVGKLVPALLNLG
ncbi:MAG: hypothetical protein U0031_21505 [Thermomicrobiales bacterium]|mgnify:CR=1 FL=1